MAKRGRKPVSTKQKALRKKAKKPPIVKDVVFATTLSSMIRQIIANIGETNTKIKRLISETLILERRAEMLKEILDIYQAAVKEDAKKEKAIGRKAA